MRHKAPLYLTVLLLASLCACGRQGQTERLTSFVDPLIGSGGHGHVFVGANVPFGMVQLGPTSVTHAWDWCSGYHQSEASVIGFSHTHLSGTGIGDLFDITVMPVIGEVTYERGTLDDPTSGLWSMADRTHEVAQPGYYAVPLTRYAIEAELTATPRVGMHRYTFPATQDAAIVIDLQNGGGWDRTTETYMKAEGNTRIVGWRHSRGWAPQQRVFFVAEFSKPFTLFSLHGKDHMYGRAHFTTTDGEELLMKVALSATGIEGARKAMQTELPGWDFDATRQSASDAWEHELSRLRIETTSDEHKRIFYTALYHTMIAPSLFSDVDGSYYGADGKLHYSATPQYTHFSLWDTYRAHQPLMTLIQPERAGQFVASMLNIFDQQGYLPIWHLWGNETHCMVGDPAIPVVADAIVKGLRGFDYERAYDAICATASRPERGKELRHRYGYIPCNLMHEAVAYDMEYALADGAAAHAAKVLGHEDDYAHFIRSSHSYRTYFDRQSYFIRGVDDRGAFRTPFSPYYATHRADDYCEGNAWQYTWLVPHDIANYATLFGSREACLARLDSLFVAPSHLEGTPSPDISGMIGQYAHGNEPSHHIPYLYALLGEPHKCAERVRQIMSTQYRATGDGLAGNEDMGQMSAWYLLSAIGFYEVEPASGRYWLGSPIVDRAVLNVEGGTFTIEVIGNGPHAPYIKHISLNGTPYTLPYIQHADIARGGVLTLTMSSQRPTTPTQYTP